MYVRALGALVVALICLAPPALAGPRRPAPINPKKETYESDRRERIELACQAIGATTISADGLCECPSGERVGITQGFGGFHAAMSCAEMRRQTSRCASLGGNFSAYGHCFCEVSGIMLKEDELDHGLSCSYVRSLRVLELQKNKKDCAEAGGDFSSGSCMCYGSAATGEFVWDGKTKCAELVRLAEVGKAKREQEAKEALEKKCAARGGAKPTVAGNCECSSGLLVEEGHTCAEIESALDADCKSRGADRQGAGCQCPTSGFPAPPGKTCAEIESAHAAKCEFLGGKAERRYCRCPAGLAISADKDKKDFCAEYEGRVKNLCEGGHAVMEPDPGKTDSYLCRCPAGGKTVNAAIGECCLRSGGTCTGTALEGGRSLDPRDSLFDLIEIGQALKFRIPARVVIIRDLSKRLSSYALDAPARIFGKTDNGYYTVKFRFVPEKESDQMFGECDVDDFPSRREVILRNCSFTDKSGTKTWRFGNVAPVSVPYGGLPHPTIPMPVCPTPPTI
jgi:hypothetical protein